MSRGACLLVVVLAAGLGGAAQQPAATSPTDVPEANPARPTVSTPATLPPSGYLQFETGYLGAWDSAEFSSQSSINEVAKVAIKDRLEFLFSWGPYAHSANGPPANGTGDVSLGVQGVIHHGNGAKPTVAVSYFNRVYEGNSPGLDIGSATNSVVLLISADMKGFHYDTNYLFNEAVDDPTGVRRAQFGQTLSVSHPLRGKWGLSGEIWHFTQPFLHGHAVGNLWAVNYNVRRNLVFDCGFNRGLTDTSTRWEVFVGFTYLLPHRLFGGT
jgi:hypothetical protein